MNYRDKIAQRIQEKENAALNNDDLADNVEAFVSSEFFGVENVRSSPACLDLRFADGSFKAIPYSYIMEINFNPGEGIEIVSTSKKVSITGRNLKLLYTYLTSYRVKYIKANIGNDLTEEKALFVKGIKIDEL